MSFEEVMGAMNRFMVATDALAAVGAHLMLQGPDQPPGDAATVAALQAVVGAAGLDGVDDLAPPQRMMLAGLVRLYFGQADDLLRQPGRPAGWTFTDPAVLEGMGRGSMMVPIMMVGAPELEKVTSLLDVGVGVGWLAVAAAGVWPSATITGIDIWDAALERASVNVREAGLDDRITIRKQDVTALDDVDAYECAWIPTFFIRPDIMVTAIGRVFTAVQPQGWIVLGRFSPLPDPLAQATTTLRTVRGGGGALSTDECTELLRGAGCDVIKVVDPPGPMPLQLVLGQKPA